MRKYYLYRKVSPIYGEWIFDDEFSSYEEAFRQARVNSQLNSWKIWKIEEVIVF